MHQPDAIAARLLGRPYADLDATTAEHDYEVNLKAELEIMLLHEKLDQLRDPQWAELLEIQRQQLALLAALAKSPSRSA